MRLFLAVDKPRGVVENLGREWGHFARKPLASVRHAMKHWRGYVSGEWCRFCRVVLFVRRSFVSALCGPDEWKVDLCSHDPVD